MLELQGAQFFLVGTALIGGIFSCFITSRPRLASCIRRAGYTKVIAVGISLALATLHMIPMGFEQLHASKSTWIQNLGGLYVAIGLVLAIFLDISCHTPSSLVVEPRLPVTMEIPKPEEQACAVLDATEHQPCTTTVPMAMHQTLYYPQYYNCGSMSNLHCNSVFAVSQLEETLAKEYPFIPQKDDIILQSFPQFNIPNYIQANPQIITAQHNPYANDANSMEHEKTGANTALQRTCAVVSSCVFYGFFLGIHVGSTQTMHKLLVLTPLVVELLVAQCFLFATFTQDAGGLRKHTVSILCMLLAMPIAAVTFIVLQIERQNSWKVVISESTAFLTLMSAGFLLYHSIGVVQTDIPRTRTSFAVIALVMGGAFLWQTFSMAV